MSSSVTDFFGQLGGDYPVAAASSRSFNDGYLGYDARLPSQRFDSFSNFTDSESVEHSLIFTSQPIHETHSPPPIYGSGAAFTSDPTELLSLSLEANGKLLNGVYEESDGLILPPPMEMQPEEGFALREWERQNAIQLEEEEKKEKELLGQIIDEADAYKVEFHRKRQVACETKKVTNKEREKLFLVVQEKFHAEANKNYWKAIAEFIPNELPTIKQKGKRKDQDKKPSIIVVQGPKPGKRTDLSRMRQILLKLKHNTPPHLMPSPPAPAQRKDTKTGDAVATTVAPSKVAVVVA